MVVLLLLALPFVFYVSNSKSTRDHNIADRVVVMYLGYIVEQGTTEQVFAPPYHPYTEALLSAVPVPDPTVEQKHIRLEGSVPSAIAPPSGCRFHPRCPHAMALCRQGFPEMIEMEKNHLVACHWAASQK